MRLIRKQLIFNTYLKTHYSVNSHKKGIFFKDTLSVFVCMFTYIKD